MWNFKMPQLTTMLKKPDMNFQNDFYRGMFCAKYMLLFSNLLFVIIGFIMLSVTTTIITIYGDFHAFLTVYFFDPLYILIGIAIVSVLVAFFGVVGIIKESRLLINMYILLLGMMIFFETVAVLLSFFQQAHISNMIQGKMRSNKDMYFLRDDSKQSWDFLQEELQCCGIQSFTDWKRTYNPNNEGASIDIMGKNETLIRIVLPESCCLTDTCELAYLRGCSQYLIGVVDRCIEMLQTGGLFLTLLQLIGAIFANKLVKAIHRSKTERDMQKYNQTSTFDEKPPVIMVQSIEEDN